MSVLDPTITSPFQRSDDDQESPRLIDLRGEVISFDGSQDRQESGERADEDPSDDVPSDAEPPRTRAARTMPHRRKHGPSVPEGVRVRRVRVGSVAKVAVVFFAVGYLAVLGTLVACWNVVQEFGFVTDVEELAITSLGLESFTIDGQQLFELSAVVLGALFSLGFVITLLLALVYNATCSLFGGVALELGPLRRTRRVFSPWHRRFVSV